MEAKKVKTGKYRRYGIVPLVRFRKVQWYWDLRLWSPIYLLVLVIGINAASKSANQSNEIGILQESPEMSFVEMNDTEIPEETEPTGYEDVIALARLADSVAAGRPAEVKKIVMWVAINRTEDRRNGYGLTLREEIARPKQWQQYDPNAVYLEETVQLAEEVYETWVTGGARPIYGDMLWFVLNGDGSITVRNQFKSGKNRIEATFGQQ